MYIQYETAVTGINFEANSEICILKSISLNIIEIQNFIVIFITLFIVVIIILIVYLIIEIIVYCIKKKTSKFRPRVAPALIAAVMGRVSARGLARARAVFILLINLQNKKEEEDYMIFTNRPRYRVF